MEKTLEKTLWQFIWRHSRRDQIRVLLLTVLSFPFLYLSLEMPKIIINSALKPGKVSHDLFGVVTIGADWYLWLLCGVFMVLVMASGMFKMRINTMKGVMGERMLRRLRYQMVQQILRFPAARFHSTSAGELVSMLNAETEPLAGYAGDALALPVFQGGTLLTILVFMFVQDLKLGLAALVAMPLQVIFIPRLQRQINVLSRQRVQQARQIAGRLDETVAGVRDIRVNGTQAYTLAGFSALFGGTFDIRLEIYQKKFLMKFLNNAMAQITPFLFFAVGGYQVLLGNLTLGALVAALSAQKELYAPWKELLGFYQIQQDARTKYDQLHEQFCPPDLLPVGKVSADVQPFSGDCQIVDLGLGYDWTLSLSAPPGSRTVITSHDLVLLDRLAMILARQARPATGMVLLDGQNIHDLPDAVIGPVIGYVGPDSHIFEGSLFDNVFYGLRHSPPVSGNNPDDIRQRAEAQAAGNSEYLAQGDWIDYAALGLEGHDQAKIWWQQIAEAIEARDGLVDPMLEDFSTGLAGSRLTLTGRQKLALARAVAKKPKMLVAHRPLQALGSEQRNRVRRNLYDLLPTTTIIWLDNQVADTQNVDQHLVLSVAGWTRKIL